MRKTIVYSLLAIFLCFAIFLALPFKSYLRKALIHLNADIDDYKIFENRPINAGNYQPWKLSTDYNKKEIPQKYVPIFEGFETVAFMVIKDSAIVFEKYWNDYDENSYSNSFSVAKSIVSLLVGCAIADGYIKSIDDPVIKYLPEFDRGENKKITIRHLLAMSSGLNWDESYHGLFTSTTKAYYGTNLKELVMNLKVVEEPGKKYKYLSCNTQILAFILEKTTGKSLSNYASEKLWIPMGAKNEALWCLNDKNDTEKAFCCFNSNARDFSRIGQLVLSNGQCNGKQLISEDYIREVASPVSWLMNEKDSGRVTNYGLHWWLMTYRSLKVIYAQGILGQYIFVVPEKKLVIVRLGEKRCRFKYKRFPADGYTWLNAAFDIANL